MHIIRMGQSVSRFLFSVKVAEDGRRRTICENANLSFLRFCSPIACLHPHFSPSCLCVFSKMCVADDVNVLIVSSLFALCCCRYRVLLLKSTLFGSSIVRIGGVQECKWKKNDVRLTMILFFGGRQGRAKLAHRQTNDYVKSCL
jgi:hypothetical protein